MLTLPHDQAEEGHPLPTSLFPHSNHFLANMQFFFGLFLLMSMFGVAVGVPGPLITPRALLPRADTTFAWYSITTNGAVICKPLWETPRAFRYTWSCNSLTL